MGTPIHIKKIILFSCRTMLWGVVGGFLLLYVRCANSGQMPEEEVQDPQTLSSWLAQTTENRVPLLSTSFAATPLTLAAANQAITALVEDHQNTMEARYGSQWNARVLEMNQLRMPFYYRHFGTPSSEGRSLYISLHGGGGTTAEVNDQQYNNQKQLYNDTMMTLEGMYLAARAPTNTWDLWHQAHVDDFLGVLIQLAVIQENVNPNKVYLLGYSAGGDGVYQLAPRMADRWAAAAMMAGHPNDASPLGLKNTPFTIHMGALDSAYDRNLKAQEWQTLLGQLQANAPSSYIHEVQLHQGLGHWMNLQDATALPWMAQYTRNPFPTEVVWKQDDRHHTRFYWLGVPANQTQTGAEVIASYDRTSNSINIEANDSPTLYLYLNDAMLDLDQPISIRFQGNEIANKVFERTTATLYESLQERGDAAMVYSVKIGIRQNNSLIE